jgi:hypothetical protein
MARWQNDRSPCFWQQCSLAVHCLSNKIAIPVNLRFWSFRILFAHTQMYTIKLSSALTLPNDFLNFKFGAILQTYFTTLLRQMAKGPAVLYLSKPPLSRSSPLLMGAYYPLCSCTLFRNLWPNLPKKDCLHWRCLLTKPSVTVTLDCTCLGHLGRRDTDRIISIYVMLPKVAKASKYWLSMSQALLRNLCQCKHSLA